MLDAQWGLSMISHVFWEFAIAKPINAVQYRNCHADTIDMYVSYIIRQINQWCAAVCYAHTIDLYLT